MKTTFAHQVLSDVALKYSVNCVMPSNSVSQVSTVRDVTFTDGSIPRSTTGNIVFPDSNPDIPTTLVAAQPAIVTTPLSGTVTLPSSSAPSGKTCSPISSQSSVSDSQSLTSPNLIFNP